MRRWATVVLCVAAGLPMRGVDFHGAAGAAVETDTRRRFQDPRPSFRAGADVVVVDVAVEERGRPVRGLQAADFTLLDNGVPQAIAGLSYEQLPIDVTIAFDLSASVSGFVLDQLRRAMGQLRSDLRPGDRLKILTFNHRISRILDLTDPAEAIDDAFARLRPAGSSAILDALAVALAAPTSPTRRYLIVLFSDGFDTSSVNDPSTLVGAVRRTRPTIVAVLPSSRITPDAIRSSDVRIDPGALGMAQQVYSLLARESGGRTITIIPDQNLSETFASALAQFRASYVLYFTPEGVAPGGVHELTVRVHRQGMEVRARREYVRR